MRSGEDLRVGDLLGRYKLVRELGRGSMGLVFLAEDTMLRTPICVKVLHPALAGHPEAAERFNREIVLARRISHKGVCRLHDIHHEGDLRFITMEFVEGQPLRDLLQNDSPKLSIDQVVTIGTSICDALAAAHDVGVVHRDLKPRNIMVRPNGEATILDFGIATALDGASSLTLPGIALGTKHYIAPEAWAGRPASPQSDQFAVGVILFNCLTRRMPFNAARDVLLLDEMNKGPPPPASSLRPDVPAALDAVVRRALSFKPEARFADVRALRDAILAAGGRATDAARTQPILLAAFGSGAPDPVSGVLPPTMPSLQAPTLQAPTLQAPTLQAPTLQAPTLPMTVIRTGASPATALEPTLVSAAPLSSSPSGTAAVAPMRPGYVPSQPDELPPSDASWVVSGRAVDLPAVAKPMPNAASPVVRGIADMIEPEERRRPKRRTPMLAAAILLIAAGVAGAIVWLGDRTSGSSGPDAGAAEPTHAADPGPPGPPTSPPPSLPTAPATLPPEVPPDPFVDATLPAPAPVEPAPTPAANDEPAERRPKRPSADAARQRYLEAKGEVTRAMAERGLLAGDDAELDRLRLRAAQEATQKRFDSATGTLGEATARAAAVVVDRGFIDRKLARFNSTFDKVTDPKRREAADAHATEVMSALAEKRYQDANDQLNRALSLIR